MSFNPDSYKDMQKEFNSDCENLSEKFKSWTNSGIDPSKDAHPNWDGFENVPMLRFATRTFFQQNYSYFLTELLSLAKNFGSPIEEKFFCSLLLSSNLHVDVVEVLSAKGSAVGSSASIPFKEMNWTKLSICPQEIVGTARVDFVLRYYERPPNSPNGAIWEEVSSIVVECDGYEFHERNRNQAVEDRRRDRNIQSMGLPVFRFLGTEIYNEPMAAADQVIRFLKTKGSGSKW